MTVNHKTLATLRHTRRPVRFVELWRCDDWTVKLYSIREGAEAPDPEFIDRAKELARGVLPQPAQTAERYGAAFVTVHQAEMFNQIIIDWWERVNELRHRVFKAPPTAPLQFEEITATGEAFCVWELAVIGFERERWLAEALENPDGPDLGAYFSSQLSDVC